MTATKGGYLFFDTETTGLPRRWDAPLKDLDNWPRLVQLAYILFDSGGNLLMEQDVIVRPDGFQIPSRATGIHGISQEMALHRGRDLCRVLNEFARAVVGSDFLVAHNIGFDEMILGAEFTRLGVPNPLTGKQKICTMKASRDYCRIRGTRGFKYPSLSELYRRLFQQDFSDAHNAAADIRATARCFWELRRRGVL